MGNVGRTAGASNLAASINGGLLRLVSDREAAQLISDFDASGAAAVPDVLMQICIHRQLLDNSEWAVPDTESQWGYAGSREPEDQRRPESDADILCEEVVDNAGFGKDLAPNGPVQAMRRK